jgi:hypothetical protein
LQIKNINYYFALQSTFIFNVMNTQQDHLDNLREIRGIMEKSTKFMSLSGLSGVFAGIYALLGGLAAYFYFYSGNIKYDEYYRVLAGHQNSNILGFLILDALIILTLALGTALILSRKKARKMSVSFWNPSAKRMLVHLAIPLLTGGAIILILLWKNQQNFIPPFTLIFYGLGLISASKYSSGEIYYLGIFEIITGLISLIIYGFDLYFWMFGFGILHIIYGALMYYRYERK